MKVEKKAQIVMRKTKPHSSVANREENEGNRVESVQRKSREPVDHWAFLAEIEAPMWADFTLELKSTSQDKDDDWFHISHPFHQCSSRQLISAFPHPGEGCTNSDFGIEGPSSPKLPPSVSRSRGKNYRSREWGQGNHKVTSNRQHPVKNLSSKSSLVNGSDKNTKGKKGCRKPEGPASSKTGSVCESGLTETAGPSFCKAVSSFGDSAQHSSSTAEKGGESNLTSTITSESNERHSKKSLDVSTQLFGRKSTLFSVLRVSVGKSCVTRQAVRMEINGGMKLEGRKSSSSKSSVGSSSNPGYDVKNQTHTATENKDRTPDSRNVMRALRNIVQVANVSKGPSFQVRNMTSNSRSTGKTIALKSTNKEAPKSKVHNHIVHSAVLEPHTVNKQGPLTAATKAIGKVGVSRDNRLAGAGKENAKWVMAASQKSSMREKAAGGVVTKRSVPQKNDITIQEKINGRVEGKKSTNVVQKVYLR